MAIADEAFDEANRRGAAKRQAFPPAVDVRYGRRISRIVISLASGLQLAFAPRDVQELEHARPVDLADAQISPSGLGVHFPHLDADICLPALLDGLLRARRAGR